LKEIFKNADQNLQIFSLGDNASYLPLWIAIEFFSSCNLNHQEFFILKIIKKDSPPKALPIRLLNELFHVLNKKCNTVLKAVDLYLNYSHILSPLFQIVENIFIDTLSQKN